MPNPNNGRTTVQGDGFRLGGTTYREGDVLPDHHARVLEKSNRTRDPAGRLVDAPPNFGRPAIPHVFTFRGVLTTLSKAYRAGHDEALRDSVANANMMVNDPIVMQAVLARQRMTALLNYHVESEDDSDPKLKAVSDELSKIVSYTPRFVEYRRNLLDAVFYGRYAVQQQFGHKTNRFGKKRVKVEKWTPIHGDKLVFRYDDGQGTYDPDQFGVRVTGAMSTHDEFAGDRDLEPTGSGLAYFFKPWERKHIALHKHMIMDGPFEDPLGGAKIHGVGIRSFIYWLWYQKQETLAQLVEVVERTGMGIQILRYPEGNDPARQEMEKVAQELAHTNVLLFPTTPNDDYNIDIVPPNTAGIDALHELIQSYFHDAIVKFILGQTLSTSAQATGLGSGVADLHEESMMQVAHYDAINLEETLTTELLNVLRDLNFPQYRNVDFFFKLDTKTPKTSELMAAAKDLYEMGAKLRESDLFDIVGLSMPKENDRFLQHPEVGPQVDQLNGDSVGAAAPDGLPGPPLEGMPEADPTAGPLAPEADSSSFGDGPDLPTDEGDDGEPLADDDDPDGFPPEAMSREQEEAKKLFGPLLHRKRVAGQVSRYKNWDESKHPRAPSGGAKVGGNEYKPGEFIPTEALQSASPRELADLSKAIAADDQGKGEAKGGVPLSQQPGYGPAKPEQPAKPQQEWPKEEEVPREQQGQGGKGKAPKGAQHIDKLNALPNGTVIDGWTAEKSTPEFGDVRLWTKGDEALTSAMLGSLYPDQVGKALEGMAKGGGGKKSPQGQPQSQQPAPDDKQHADNLQKVSSLFGIAPGDAKNEKRAGAFALRTARALGLDPQGKTRDEQVRHATEFLARSHAPLSSLVSDAEAAGFKSRATNLVTKSRNAAKWVTDQAESAGYKVQGKSDFERFRGALGYLQGMEAKKKSQTPPPVPEAPPVQGHNLAALAKKVSDWAGTSVWKWAAVAFAGYAVLSLARGSRRRASFFGKQWDESEHDRATDGQFSNLHGWQEFPRQHESLEGQQALFGDYDVSSVGAEPPSPSTRIKDDPNEARLFEQEGEPMLYAEEPPEVTGEDLGYQVPSPIEGDQCGNCRYFADGSCTLYRWLNQKYPETANFWGIVDPAGWCESHTGEADAPSDGKRYALTLIHQREREVPA